MRIKTKNDLINAFDSLLEDPNLQVRLLNTVGNGFVNRADVEVFKLLNLTLQTGDQKWMQGKCGQTAPLMCDIFNQLASKLGILHVTANVDNGSFHQYNVVSLEGEPEIQIFDASAAQFFSNPIEAFEGKPYFFGTRDELRELVKERGEHTLIVLQKKFSEMKFMTLEDVDRACRADYETKVKIGNVLHEKGSSNLNTEYLDQAFEATWGNQSSFRSDALGNRSIESSDWNNQVINGYNEHLNLP